MTGRGGESPIPTDGTEKRSIHLRVAAVENLPQWAKAWRSDAAWLMKSFET